MCNPEFSQCEKIVKKPTLRFYSDDGHGWLAVKRQKLIDLGLMEKISPFSYQRGNTVYLEEDCDITVFLKACGCITFEQTREKFNCIEKHTNGRHPIRSYDIFTPSVFS